MESMGKQYDKLVLEAFANYGYTEEWLLNKANLDRVHRYILKFEGVDEWAIDNVVLFRIKREACFDQLGLMPVVRLTLTYKIGNFPEKTVTANGFE